MRFLTGTPLCAHVPNWFAVALESVRVPLGVLVWGWWCGWVALWVPRRVLWVAWGFRPASWVHGCGFACIGVCWLVAGVTGRAGHSGRCGGVGALWPSCPCGGVARCSGRLRLLIPQCWPLAVRLVCGGLGVSGLAGGGGRIGWEGRLMLPRNIEACVTPGSPAALMLVNRYRYHGGTNRN